MTHRHISPSEEPRERELPDFSPMQKIKRRFFAMRNGALASQMRAAGLDYRVNFGLNIPQVKEIAADIIGWQLPSSELMALASELWDNVNTRESRLIAPMLYTADIMDPALAERWLAEAQTTEVADHLCHSLLRRLPYAFTLASNLLARPDATDMNRYSAARLILNLLCIGKAAPAEVRDATASLRQGCPSLVAPLLRQIDQELEWLEEDAQ